MLIDLRSDTVTMPTPEMRRAIFEAEVGDDGYGEDPSVHELEELGAAFLGMPDAIFVPSGTMANQIALRTFARPGEVVIVGAGAHLLQYERGASAKNALVQFHAVDDSSGYPNPEEVAKVIGHYRFRGHPVALVAVENTHMSSGGMAIPRDQFERLLEAAQGIPVYIDGARIANAQVTLGVPAADIGRGAQMVSMCLSKGLGAPMGSVLAGSRELVGLARQERALLGGRLRQIGFMAAAGVYALRNNVERLADDHVRALRLATILRERLGEEAVVSPVHSNMVLLRHDRAPEAVAHLAGEGVLANALSERLVRFVTHIGISDEDIEVAADRVLLLIAGTS